MLLLNNLAFVALLVPFRMANPQLSTSQKLVSEACLDCICETASGCKEISTCPDHACGAFLITQPYWVDAGRPKLHQNLTKEASVEFLECTYDISCAKRTIEEYMHRKRVDCNEDGVINCDDYVAIHMLGPIGCLRKDQMKEYKLQRYKQCLARITVSPYM